MSFNFVMMGASGRMGQCIISNSEIVSAKCTEKLGRNISEKKEAPRDTKIMIDFSLPESIDEVIRYCRENSVSLVSGVTGYSDEDLNKLRLLSKDVAVFWSPNMSLGIAVVRKMIEKFKAIADWDFHIHEAHHINKIDRPSGTAKYLESSVETAIGKACPVSDMRGGGVFGVHDTYALGEEEEIQLSHRAYSRDVFAKGSLRVAEWLKDQKPGFYSMDSFLDD